MSEPTTTSVQVDAGEVVDELVQQIAQLTKQNAILRVQLRAQQKPQVAEAPPA